ncbi:unnamed protein product [Adineta steineri]|uniref:Uncharacterized protein n=1 Tax=Adineta steineri TaxID=433720 RepID=A0A820AML3_9BILA|nr:unnamed protein product [Adineta steineri]CAF4191799.1 unnamed protein product [Adineta steineri]
MRCSGYCSIFIYGFALMLALAGTTELYRSKEFIIGQCQINSIIMIRKVGPKGRDVFFQHWNVTVIYENEIDNILIITPGGGTYNLERFTSRKYQANEIYPCYHSPYNTTDKEWDWQWTEPKKQRAYGYLTGALAFFIAGTILIISRIRSRYLRKQQQHIDVSLRTEDQTQITTLL